MKKKTEKQQGKRLLDYKEHEKKRKWNTSSQSEEMPTQQRVVFTSLQGSFLFVLVFAVASSTVFYSKNRNLKAASAKTNQVFFGKLYDEHSPIVFDANKQEKIRRIRICFETI